VALSPNSEDSEYVLVYVVLPSSIDKSQRDSPPPMWRSREGLRMKSNLQGRRNDRKGGLSPPPNTAKLPAGTAVRWSYPRKEFVNCKTDKTGDCSKVTGANS